MATKIEQVTIVCSQGVKQYEVGGEHNGMVIDRIDDKAVEYESVFHSIYIGFTKENDIVFETYNAPTEVSYKPV